MVNIMTTETNYNYIFYSVCIFERQKLYINDNYELWICNIDLIYFTMRASQKVRRENSKKRTGKKFAYDISDGQHLSKRYRELL